MDFLYRLQEFISRLPYLIYYGIKNLLIWFPIIWQDRNWDSYFIYKLLSFKLNLTEKHIRKHDRHTTSVQDANRIKVCILLLDRLIKDEYEENCFKKVDEKWGELKMNLDDNHKIKIYREKVLTEKDHEKERKQSKECYRIADEMRKQDKKLLFTYLFKHIDKWWD